MSRPLLTPQLSRLSRSPRFSSKLMSFLAGLGVGALIFSFGQSWERVRRADNKLTVIPWHEPERGTDHE